MTAILPELGREKFLGFDTETKPNFEKGQNHPPSLLQLAGDNGLDLHAHQAGAARRTTRYSGRPGDHQDRGSGGLDLQQLQRLGPFQLEGFAELATVAKESGIKNHGLRGLATVMLGYCITKGAQRSNWVPTA